MEAYCVARYGSLAASLRCRILAAKRSAKCDRLTGYHGGSGLSDNGCVSVRHPTHDHRIRIDVWPGNIAIGADDFGKRLNVRTRQSLNFGLRQRVRIYPDSALATTEGRLITAHFMVIEKARFSASSAVASGSTRISPSWVLMFVIAVVPRHEAFAKAASMGIIRRTCMVSRGNFSFSSTSASTDRC